MANPHRAEVSLPVGGETYILCFTTNALCSLEDALDLSVNEIMNSLSDGMRVRMKTIRALAWAGLCEKQPTLTLKGAGDIIQEGGAVFIMEKLTEALQLAFPAEAKSDEPRPT